MEQREDRLEEPGKATAEQTTVVGSRYRVTRKLGEGGMGAVFAAEHTTLGRAAAIKVLQPELSQDRESVDRFFNEARAATAINHPGIVKVYDFGHQDDGSAYIAMEFLDGEDLETRLRRDRRVPVAQALRLLAQITDALKAAHNHGIVHRDLKPANIFLVPDPQVAGGERVKLLDFGIAKISRVDFGDDTQKTRSEDFLGTPTYMAPEQCRSAGTVDQRSDLYSLGCIVYEMLCGQPPFTGLPAMIIASHLRDDPAPPSALQPDVSPELEGIVLRLLAKDPRERFRSADELEHVLSMMPGAPASILSVTGASRPGGGSWILRQAWGQTTARLAGRSLAGGQTEVDPMQTAMITLPRRRPVAMVLAMLVVFSVFTSVMLYTRLRPRAPAPRPRVEVPVPVEQVKLTRPPRVAISVKLLTQPEPEEAPEPGAEQEEEPAEARSPLAMLQDIFEDKGIESARDLLSFDALAALAESIKVIAEPEPVLVTWKIDTTPSGAQILHEDGRVLGKTPLLAELEPVSADDVERVYEKFTLRLEGHEDVALELRYDRSEEHAIALQPLLVRAVVTEPPGADVRAADGTRVAVTPWEVRISRQDEPREYVLSLAHFEDRPLTIAPGVELPGVIALEPTYQARLATEPPGAAVHDAASGARLGTTPLAIELSREDPPVSLVLRKERHEDLPLTVHRGDDLSAPVALVPYYVAVIRSRPRRAAVHDPVTGAKIADTPYEIALSREDPPVSLVLRKERHEDLPLTVHHGDDLSEPVALEGLYTATVRARPRRADVLDPDGNRLGRTPYQVMLSRQDPPLTLVLHEDGHEPETVTVRHGDDLSAPIALSKIPVLVVRTRPGGASVHDPEGEKLGETPWTIAFRRGDGPRDIVLRHTGYEEMAMTLRPDDRLPRVIELVARVDIELVSRPPGATIHGADGERVGVAPVTVTLRRGRRPETFTFQLAGHLDQTVRVVPRRSGTERVAMRPLPRDIAITIQSEPSGAELLLKDRRGDKLIGTTPYTMVVKESPERVRLLLRHAGYRDEELRVPMDREDRITVTLSRECDQRTALSSRIIVNPYDSKCR